MWKYIFKHVKCDNSIKRLFLQVRSFLMYVCYRHEWQQKILKEELARMAQKGTEVAREDVTKVLTRERLHARQEAEKAKKLV